MAEGRKENVVFSVCRALVGRREREFLNGESNGHQVAPEARPLPRFAGAYRDIRAPAGQ